MVMASLDSPDAWISVTAAESLGRLRDRADTGGAEARRSSRSGQTGGTPHDGDSATSDAGCRRTGRGGSARGRSRHARLIPPARGGGGGGNRAGGGARPAPAHRRAAMARPAGAAPLLLAVVLVARRLPAAATRGAGRPPIVARPIAEYRALVERYIVPDYNGAKPPRAVWTSPAATSKSSCTPGDAPLGTEHFVRVVESGSIVGTEFTRVVANFVDQQATIKDATLLRDEVNRHGLTRGNLAWASAGLDTGRPGTRSQHAAGAQRRQLHSSRPRRPRHGRGRSHSARRRDHCGANGQVARQGGRLCARGRRALPHS